MRQKTEYLNLRIHPAIKEAIRVLAAKEYRSVASMIEVMVRERCEKVGVRIEGEPTPPKRTPRKNPGGTKE